MKLVLLCAVALPAGCASVSHADRDALMTAPIECSMAEADILALEIAQPSGGERARSIFQSVTPVGLVTGAASGSYRDRAAVATGKTQSNIDARIEEIEQSCRPPEAASQTEHKD